MLLKDREYLRVSFETVEEARQIMKKMLKDNPNRPRLLNASEDFTIENVSRYGGAKYVYWCAMTINKNGIYGAVTANRMSDENPEADYLYFTYSEFVGGLALLKEYQRLENDNPY